ncbi:cyanophycinase [Ancylomarina longa]|uniref:Cyanophycinase n=1 Tax=Ancylomarina longa TaxID=2487017 RepID=A0A434AV56_9BACT|nr:cyanophycinase [Ancylomarina longa]RUT78246.1 cyanophycinase [Ancylomarina longa]
MNKPTTTYRSIRISLISLLFTFFLTFSISSVTFSQSQGEQYITHGPKNGTLIIIGGGLLDATIYDEFKKQAGSDSAKIVVIPTAMDDNYLQHDSSFSQIKKNFASYGFSDITIMHTRDTSESNRESFLAPLEAASGVYFLGGRQWRLADAYLNTKVQEELFKLLERGGVIAGSSAGATIQGSYLARGDTKNNQIMMGDHEKGLGFLTNVAIDQHVMVRNRQFDLFDILQRYPYLLGIGLDENTAIVVKGDEFKVIGKSYVLIYDQSFWSREGSELKHLPEKDKLFYILRKGDKYNLSERKVMK